jgi:hypothetical protein
MTQRLLRERMLRFITPRPDLDFTPPPVALAPGLWSLERQVRFGAAVMPSRSIVVDVGARRLVLISPPADACAELDRLGTLAAIVAPNSFHYLYAGAYLQRYPGAELFVAPELPERVPSLPRAVELVADLDVGWRDALPYVVLGPHRGLSEVLFFHAATRTLILTDIASNLVSFRNGYERLLWRSSGMPSGFGLSRNARRLLLRDRTAARAALRTAARWPFERIVMAHGAVVERDAHATFTSAYAGYL